jgi:hypothetical protein
MNIATNSELAAQTLEDQAKQFRQLAERLEADAQAVRRFDATQFAASPLSRSWETSENAHSYFGTPRKETLQIVYDFLAGRPTAHRKECYKAVRDKGIAIKIDTLAFYMANDERFAKAERGYWQLAHTGNDGPNHDALSLRNSQPTDS